MLDGYGKKKPEGDEVTTCLMCYRAYYKHEFKTCPNGCIKAVTERGPDSGIETVDGTLFELTDDYFKEDADKPTEAEVLYFIAYLLGIKEARGFKGGWLYHRVNTFFGDETHGKEVCKKFGGLIYKANAQCFSELMPSLSKFAVTRHGLEECYRVGANHCRGDLTRGFGWKQRHTWNYWPAWNSVMCGMQSGPRQAERSTEAF